VPIALSEYRERLEAMTVEAMEEYLRHFAGHKPTLELAPIYERYADLATLEQARALEGAPTELRRFACETYVGNGTKELVEAAANTEAQLTVPFDGGEVPYRAVRPTLMNEPDRARRADLYARRVAATAEHLNPIHAERFERERELVRDLGAGSVLELYKRLGFDPEALHRETDRFLSDTEDMYQELMPPAFQRRVGVPLEEATPADLLRFGRAPEFDRGFPAASALPALRATLAELGIDLNAQRNVELDIEPRAGKIPRAFCAPVRVPDRVVLVTLPQGGGDDYLALFHEAGHMEHFAHTDRSLPAEDRVLGDNGVTEAWAFLLEHLVVDPAWLTARLDFGDVEDYRRFSALQKLFYLRRYCAKLAYELGLHSGGSLDALPARYAELLHDATGIRYPAEDYLEDVDPGFYVTFYLRAWALEAQLADVLRSEFGTTWFRRRAAGDFLRELWALGQSRTADELAREVTGAPIEFGVLAEELERALG
jgi:hypothetical protein